jgi:hypothetical protein
MEKETTSRNTKTLNEKRKEIQKPIEIIKTYSWIP